MVTSFLIEFRLKGYSEKYAKWVSWRVRREARRLRIRRLSGHKFIPHITLFGSSITHSLRRIAIIVEEVGRKYSSVPFSINGFDAFRNKDELWLYLDVQPSTSLECLRYELAQRLLRSERTIRENCPPYDKGKEYAFHCAIGKFDPRDRINFEQLVDFAKTRCALEDYKRHRASLFVKLIIAIKNWIFKTVDEDQRINQHLIRITILGRRSRIYREYDLILKRLFSSREALSHYWWRSTIENLKMIAGG